MLPNVQRGVPHVHGADSKLEQLRLMLRRLTNTTTGTFLFFSSDAFDNELIMQTLREILQGKTVQIPVYDFVTHSR